MRELEIVKAKESNTFYLAYPYKVTTDEGAVPSYFAVATFCGLECFLQFIDACVDVAEGCFLFDGDEEGYPVEVENFINSVEKIDEV